MSKRYSVEMYEEDPRIFYTRDEVVEYLRSREEDREYLDLARVSLWLEHESTDAESFLWRWRNIKTDESDS